MSAVLSAERAALDALATRWEKRGYQVVRAPTPDQLPAFLAGFRPDAIAIGAKPSLIIEVLQAGVTSTEGTLRRLQDLVKNEAEWRVEAVYVRADQLAVSAVGRGDIAAAIAQAQRLAETEPRAALLLAWSALEAAGRMREPMLSEGGLTAGSLIDVLVSNGYLTQDEGSDLHHLATRRNLLAHGQLDLAVTKGDVARLGDLALGLLAEAGAA